jgi:protein TonB
MAIACGISFTRRLSNKPTIMESNKILDADILDIIFEGRNKEYGAYQLRKSYNRRLTKAMLGMGALIMFLLGGYFLAGLHAAPGGRFMTISDPILTEVNPKKDDPIIIPPKPEPIQIKTKQFTSIIQIVKDVKPEERPPEQIEVVDTKIGTINQDGIKDEEITAPPSDGDRGVVAAPPKTENDDLPFNKVEIESSYPGGMSAWKRYLERNLRVTDEAVNNGIQGTIIVQFIVDREGNVSDVHAISGPEQGGLRQEAERVIKKSGKWVPAIQNGRSVKSYKSQSVTFQLGDQ